MLLPDAIQALSRKRGYFLIGISAVSDSGKESDITVLNNGLDLSIPDAPKDLQVHDINLGSGALNLQKLVMASLGIILLTGVGIFALIKFGERNLDRLDETRISWLV